MKSAWPLLLLSILILSGCGNESPTGPQVGINEATVLTNRGLVPDIDGELVVWQHPNLVAPNLQLLNLSSSQLDTVSSRVSSGPFVPPRIADGRIAWVALSGSRDSSSLLIYDIGTGALVESTYPMSERRPFVPAIDGDWIVFEERQSGIPGDLTIVRARNMRTGKQVTVPDSPGGEIQPDVGGGILVYVDNEPIGGGISGMVKTLELETGQVSELTPNPGKVADPSTDGRIVVWQSVEPDGRSIIRMNDLRTGETGPVSPSDRKQRDPHISGRWIVWKEGDRRGPGPIVLFDLESRQRIELTPDQREAVRVMPRVSGNRVVWREANTDGLFNVMMSELIFE